MAVKMLWDYVCSEESCDKTWEKLVCTEERDLQECMCGEKAIRKMATPLGIGNYPNRKRDQLKKRSKEHMAHCEKTGNHPDSVGSYNPGNSEWRSRTRAKNTSPSTMSQLASLPKKMKGKPRNEFI